MPVFISYSHQDREIANRIAFELVRKNAHIWVDRWELKVGDSLVAKIQEALEEAEAIVLVLTESFVASEWCKKEFTSAITRELEERHVIVLPVLAGDCTIPLFLREKRYADVRKDFDDGLRDLLEALSSVLSEANKRVTGKDYTIDTALEWGVEQGHVFGHIWLLEQASEQPFSILSEVVFAGDERATTRYKQFCDAGLDWFGRLVIVGLLADALAERGGIVNIQNSPSASHDVTIRDSKRGLEYVVKVESRRLGEDTGKDVRVNVASQLASLADLLRKSARQLNPDEQARLSRILTTPW